METQIQYLFYPQADENLIICSDNFQLTFPALSILLQSQTPPQTNFIVNEDNSLRLALENELKLITNEEIKPVYGVIIEIEQKQQLMSIFTSQYFTNTYIKYLKLTIYGTQLDIQQNDFLKFGDFFKQFQFLDRFELKMYEQDEMQEYASNIFEGMGQLQQLEELKLTYNISNFAQQPEQCYGKLIKSLNKMAKLQRLDLCNNFDGKQFEFPTRQFFQNEEHLNQLQILRLVVRNLADLDYLFFCLKELNNLIEIALCSKIQHRFYVREMRLKFPENPIPQMKNLQKLSIEIIESPSSCDYLEHFEYKELGEMKLMQNLLFGISNIFKNQIQLKRLEILFQLYTIRIVHRFEDMIDKETKKLQIPEDTIFEAEQRINNCIGIQAINDFYETIQNLRNLTELYFKNQFVLPQTFDNFVKIPRCLTQLQRLKFPHFLIPQIYPCVWINQYNSHSNDIYNLDYINAVFDLKYLTKWIYDDSRIKTIQKTKLKSMLELLEQKIFEKRKLIYLISVKREKLQRLAKSFRREIVGELMELLM